MTSTTKTNDPLDFLHGNPGAIQSSSDTALVHNLLLEIVRVKALIQHYDSIENGGGKLGSAILNELVLEAYNSLVNYDVLLMRKYYELLLNCD
jgi:hypothetical protein